MHHYGKTTPYAGIMLSILAALGLPAFAAPVISTAVSGPFNPSTTTDEIAFAGDVSTTDLLTGIVGTGGVWNVGGGSGPSGLNDGNPGGDYDLNGISALTGTAWAMDGTSSSRTFVLGSGLGGLGYDITGIQSIAAWQGAGFSNQKYHVFVRAIGGKFTLLTSVDYQPFTANITSGGSTKVNITDESMGPLASGIDAIRFDILDTVSDNGGGVVMREIDVFGMESGPDETPPMVTGLNPANGISGVLPNSNLVITFDENIARGSGNITLKNLDASSETIIPISDPQISLAGAILTINPITDLAIHTHYAVQIDATAIDDASGNSFNGIADDFTWAFETGEPDVISPTIAKFSPADGSIDVPTGSNLTATFSEVIALGTGTVTLKNLDTSSDTVITLPDARVTVSGAVLTINPSTDLTPTARYAIRVSATAITDISGNLFTGISDDTTWNFITATVPLRIMCLGDSITVGYTDNPSWANHPFMFGYRSGLYTLLTNAGYNFQFVGASTEPWTGISGDPTHGGTYQPALDLRDFGQDGHRGYGGASIGATNGGVAGYIAADQPDIILLLIGINGIGSGSPAALNTLVNNIVTSAPNAHLIVAQITPLASFNQSLFDYNLYIRDTLVPNYASLGKKISTVDLYSSFLTNPSTYTNLPSTPGAVQPGVLSNSINHPDNPHYSLMAQKWFEGIGALGLGPNNFNSYISNPAFGIDAGDQDFNDDPDGDLLANGLEAWFGTHPDKYSSGIANVVRNGNTITFTHPFNISPPSDVSGSYEWSLNLVDWYAGDGVSGPSGGPTVTMTHATSGATTTVTTTLSQAEAKIFLRAVVTRS